MTLTEATRQYQNALEAHRRNPDCEGIWQECMDAHAAMTDAWVQRAVDACVDSLKSA